MPNVKPKPVKTRIQTQNNEIILAAALEVFSNYGFRGSTVDQIAQRANMSKPNLLYYFRRKEDIYVAVLEKILADWLAPFESLNEAGEPIAEITRYIAAKMELSRRNPDASRLFANSRRNLLLVERRINRARYLNAPDTAVLIEELGRDRARLEVLKQEAAARRAEAEARLQMIEAAASRGASWAETNYMLQRLDEGRKHLPLGLENARAEQELREDADRELRKELMP